jgi:uncharacterized protein (TIGR03437 family)
MRHIPLRSLLIASLAVSAALGTSALVGFIGPTGPAAATSAPTVKRVSPIGGPADTSIPVAIHGRGFDTTVGATTVSFGGTPAVSVDCTSPSLCRAISPNLSAGTVDVTVTTDGMTLNPETFTIAPYSPPLVRLVLNARGTVEFSMGMLMDKYPAQGTQGNDYVVIENTTAVAQNLTTNSLGSASIAPGDSEGFVMAADDGPYIFFTSGSPAKTLTVKTRHPA